MNNQVSKQCGDSFFPINKYRFLESYSYQFGFLKTELHHNMSKQQMEKITIVNHPNIIGLKKIAKPRKSHANSQLNDLGKNWEKDGGSMLSYYLLYYETVPFSLEASLSKPMINIRPQILQKTLQSVNSYLQSLSIFFKFSIDNVGISETGAIKIYIPVTKIIQNFSSQKTLVNQHELEQCQRSIFSIISWYQKKYARNSQPSPTINKPLNINKAPSINSHSNKLFSNSKIMNPNKLNDKNRVKTEQQQYKQLQLESNKLRQFQYGLKNNRQVRDKTIQIPTYLQDNNKNKRLSGGIDRQASSQEKDVFDKKGPNFNKEKAEANGFLQQQNINCINIYHNSGRPIHIANTPLNLKNNTQKKQQKSRLQLPSPHRNHMNYYHHDFDNQSVDTYRMELGDDYEMPKIGAQQVQRLRQTVLNKDCLNNWDTMSHRTKQVNNHGKGLRKPKVSQSAGYHDFQRIIQKNRKMLAEGPNEIHDKRYDGDPENDNMPSERQTIFLREQDKQEIKKYNSEGKNLLQLKNDSNLQTKSNMQNWQYQTIRSSHNNNNGPDIQDRVQQALLKTKNVMNMLKNCRNSSAGK